MVANPVRRDRTRKALIESARELVARDGYADTSTPAITAEAGVSRGAMYHHFADKRALFRAVIEAEQKAVAEEIRRVELIDDPVQTMINAGERFLKVMEDQGTRRLLHVEGPAVLGEAEMRRLDAVNGGGTLAEGLEMALAQGSIEVIPVKEMADLLSAAYDRAAAEGTARHRDAMRTIIEGLRVRTTDIAS